MFLVALAARLLIAVVVATTHNGYLFEDDRGYLHVAAQAAEGHTGGWDDYTRFLFHSNLAFLGPIAGLFAAFGVHPLLAQSLVAVMGALTAVFVFRVAAEVTSSGYALWAGLAVALLPAQVLFSALTLKDAFVWADLSALAWLAALAGRTHGRVLFRIALLVAALLVTLGYLRQHTLVVAAWSLALTTWAAGRRDALVRTAVALSLALFVPAAVGAGIGGVGLVHKVGNLEQQRALGAQGAETAVVAPAPTQAAVGPTGRTKSAPLPGPPGAAASATPTPSAPGVTPAPSGTDSGLQQNLHYLPYGLSVMLLQPYPWQATGNSRLRLAQAETLAWYPLLALAICGALSARRGARALAFPIVVGGGIALMWALVEGNLGTAYRHRGEFVWAAAVLAAQGCATLAGVVRRARGGMGAA